MKTEKNKTKRGRLIASAFSHFRKDKGELFQYAAAGELVTIIAESGNMAIVENNKGERFPVSINNLSLE